MLQSENGKKNYRTRFAQLQSLVKLS